MVESVGPSTIKANDLRVASVARVSAPAPAAPLAANNATTATAAPQTLAKSLAAEPPVDGDRVQQIKTAIANGTFPLSPATIADQFIALRFDWMANEQA
ncbi:flagellar biosynthesis anti-sigma factor FlgM [Sphingomonas sp. RRHST34]|jgi:negative regulator of flagellin synthesis FlgM|uniref:Negative regulator of flagellin synthesis n=1 Tax=Sphingomonas citri TaxID=2862499 RepID=A0ABS7BRF3_9SPHN|nr:MULTISPECIES: flagellar biosynthesis anti-sigma factor FlgM [Sphingomonas]MBW6532161.1 flagellar biosynthesis anti-sigma factor FlgM [Sphingomonas citri]TCP35566.1 FlgM family anti-sigma-28 factor [Sphingomonas sp. BK235]